MAVGFAKYQLLTINYFFMDWNSRRITSILENALLEDKATADATTKACIDPKQLGLALIRTKQDCVLSGLGAITRIFVSGIPKTNAVISRRWTCGASEAGCKCPCDNS